MATVPGQPIEDATGGIPAELWPGPEHLLMAVAIMDQQGRMQPLDIRPVDPKGPRAQSQESGGAYNAPRIPTDPEKFMKFRLPKSGILEGEPKQIPQVEGLY